MNGGFTCRVWLQSMRPHDVEAATLYCMLNGTITAVDAIFVDWFGMDVEDCVGRPLMELVQQPGDVQRLLARFADMRSDAADGTWPIEAGQCQLPEVWGGLPEGGVGVAGL